jgi:hypothetical protein
MKPQIECEEQRPISILRKNKLAACDRTAEKSAALLRLRRWYQSGGSDRVPLVRHWAFLKWLVVTGRLEV